MFSYTGMVPCGSGTITIMQFDKTKTLMRSSFTHYIILFELDWLVISMITPSGIVDGVFNIVFRLYKSRLEAAPTCIDDGGKLVCGFGEIEARLNRFDDIKVQKFFKVCSMVVGAASSRD